MGRVDVGQKDGGDGGARYDALVVWCLLTPFGSVSEGMAGKRSCSSEIGTALAPNHVPGSRESTDDDRTRTRRMRMAAMEMRMKMGMWG